MSSIGNDYRGEDVIRRVKKDYQNREVENNRKHNEEVQELREDHEKELAEIKAAQDKKLDQLQAYHRSRISDQEHEHQEKMQEMRDAYSSQMKRQRESSSEEIRVKDATYTEQMARQKNLAQSQKDRLSAQFQADIKKKDADFSQYVLSSKEESAKLWEERRDKLQEAARKQMESERLHHDEQLVGMNRKLNETETLLEADIAYEKKRNALAQERVEKLNQENLSNLERRNAAVHQTMTHQAQEEQRLAKQQYRAEIEEKKAGVEAEKEDFKERVTERINTEVSGLKRALKNEKEDRATERSQARRQESIQRKSLIGEYERRIDEERQQRKQMLEKSKMDISGEINRAVASKDLVIKNMTEDNLREKELLKTQSKSQISQLESEKRNFEDDLKDRSETTMTRVKEAYLKDSSRAQRAYDKNIELIKKDFINELNAERNRHIEERAQIEARLENRVRERERNLNRELDSKISMYENRLQEQQDAFRDAVIDKERRFQEQIQNRDRAHRDELKMVELKYQNQVQQTRDNYELELENRDKRHQVEVNQMTQKVMAKQRES